MGATMNHFENQNFYNDCRLKANSKSLEHPLSLNNVLPAYFQSQQFCVIEKRLHELLYAVWQTHHPILNRDNIIEKNTEYSLKSRLQRLHPNAKINIQTYPRWLTISNANKILGENFLLGQRLWHTHCRGKCALCTNSSHDKVHGCSGSIIIKGVDFDW